jgi:translation initiation factor eIF-2B subunit gamma
MRFDVGDDVGSEGFGGDEIDAPNDDGDEGIPLR